MIEDGKESVLATFCAVKELHIVNDQDINQLIEVYEVVDRIVAAMILELVDEFFRAYVQHNLLWMKALYLVANCLTKVCFSQSDTTINNQWVEGVSARLF